MVATVGELVPWPVSPAESSIDSPGLAPRGIPPIAAAVSHTFTVAPGNGCVTSSPAYAGWLLPPPNSQAPQIVSVPRRTIATDDCCLKVVAPLMFGASCRYYPVLPPYDRPGERWTIREIPDSRSPQSLRGDYGRLLGHQSSETLQTEGHETLGRRSPAFRFVGGRYWTRTSDLCHVRAALCQLS